VASALCPELGPGYDAFLRQALAIDPARRFASGGDFAAALEAAHASRGSAARAVAAAGTPTPLTAAPDQESATMAEARPAPQARPSSLLGPTVLRPAQPAPAGPPPPVAAGHRSEARSGAPAPRAAMLARFIVAAVSLVFIVQVTYLTDYINNGHGWKSLLQSSSHDKTSTLNPTDFWVPVALAALAFVLCLLSAWSRTRRTAVIILIVALSLVGYTLYIPIKAYPGFHMYGTGYWLSLAAAGVMAAGAAVAVAARRRKA
jgi:hypothetical protein